MFKSLFAVAALVVTASPAAAGTYLFTLTGSDNASFMLNSSPTVDASDSYHFDLHGVSGTFSGASGTTTSANLAFYTEAAKGGLDALSSMYGQLFSLPSAQLFTGSTTRPTFMAGSYDIPTNSHGQTVNDHLTITDVSTITGYLFTLTGTDTASFILSGSPTVDASDPYYFALHGVLGTFSVASGTTTSADLAFYTEAAKGGFDALSSMYGQLFSLPSAQLFTGSTTSPTFRPGSYDIPTNSNGQTVNDHLTITALFGATPAVPEVATWAMMIAGFGAIGVTMRRKKAAAFA